MSRALHPESATNAIPTSADESSAWTAAASALAEWTLARLVNRLDAYGAYRPVEEIGREYTARDGSKGRLAEQLTVKGRLTTNVLIRHFQARDRSAVVGLHTADMGNRSKGGGLDIDWHGPASTAPAVNLRAALHWYAVLVRLGFHPLLVESNGKGGYHLRVLLAELIDAAPVFYFLKSLTADYRQLGFTAPPEQFPKQPDVRRCAKGYGNWLRLPGRHHKRDFWSRVWDGNRWLAGHAAIDFILALKGDSPGLMPPAPVTPKASRIDPEALEKISKFDVFYKVATRKTASLPNRIAAYMRRLPNRSEGQGRDDVAFNFAAWLVRDMDLDDGIALDWLERWDAGNSPPKGRDRLAEIIKSAHTYGQRVVGCARQPEAAQVDRHGHRILRATAEVW